MAQLDLTTNFPFGVSSRGMPVIGGGGRETTGNVYFVSSTSSGKSDNTNDHGTNALTPFATLDYAIGACTANNGDLIYLMPGHAETIITAAGISADVAGITIIGLGIGTNRPTFTFSSSTTADINIDAANIYIENVVFDFTGVDALIAPIDVNASDFTMLNCEVITATAGNQCVTSLLTDNNASRLKILHCLFRGSANAGQTSVLEIAGTPDGVEIGYCRMQCYSTNGLYVSGNVTNIYIHHNNVANTVVSGTPYGINLVAGTGLVSYNQVATADVSFAIKNNAFIACIENYGYDNDLATAQIQQLIPSPSGNYVAAGLSLYDIIAAEGQEFSPSKLRYVAVTADFTSATWNTVAAHEIFTVTGAVHVKIIPVCTISLTNAGGGTIILGTETTTNGMITSTTAANITAGLAWLTATPNHLYAKTSVLDFIVAGGQDIGYTLGTAAETAGSITFHCFWEPVSSTGAVVAGAGGVL